MLTESRIFSLHLILMRCWSSPTQVITHHCDLSEVAVSLISFTCSDHYADLGSEGQSWQPRKAFSSCDCYTLDKLTHTCLIPCPIFSALELFYTCQLKRWNPLPHPSSFSVKQPASANKVWLVLPSTSLVCLFPKTSWFFAYLNLFSLFHGLIKADLWILNFSKLGKNLQTN